MQTPFFRFVYTDFKTAGIVKGLQQESFIAHLIDDMMDADLWRRKQAYRVLVIECGRYLSKRSKEVQEKE